MKAVSEPKGITLSTYKQPDISLSGGRTGKNESLPFIDPSSEDYYVPDVDFSQYRVNAKIKQLFRSAREYPIELMRRDIYGTFTDRLSPKLNPVEQCAHLLILNGIQDSISSDTVYSPQGLDVNVNHKWGGENLLSALHDYLKPQNKTDTQEEDTEYSFYTAKTEQEVDYKYVFMAFLVLGSVLLYRHTKNNSLKYIIVVSVIAMTMAFTKSHQPIPIPQPAEVISMFDMNEDQIVPDDTVFQPEGLDDYLSPIVTLCLSMLSVIVGYKAKPCAYNALLQVSKVSSSQVNNVSTAVLSVISKLSMFLKEILGNDIGEYFYVDLVSSVDVTQYVDNTETFISHFNAGVPETSAQTRQMLEDLIEDGKRIHTKLDKRSYDSRVVSQYLDKLNGLSLKHREMALAPSGYRVEPVGILFSGPPSSFKTVLMRRVAKLVARATIPELWREAFIEDDKEFFYSVPADQWWDNYTNKAWVTTFDDIFQSRDSAGDPESDALKIISMINTSAWPLKMAKAEMKNNTFFTSAFVMASTNLTDFNQIYSVRSPSAVKRRFHIEVDVKLSDKYKESGDLELPLLEGATYIPNDVCTLNVRVKDGNKVVPYDNLSMSDLIRLIIMKRHKHVANFNVNSMTENMLVSELEREFSDSNSTLVPEGLGFTPSDMFNASQAERDVWEDHIRICGSYKMLEYVQPSKEELFGNLPLVEGTHPNYWKDPKTFTAKFSLLLSESKKNNTNPYTGKRNGVNFSFTGVTDKIDKFSNWMKENWFYLLAGGTIIFPLCYKLYSVFNSDSPMSSIPESVDYGRMKSNGGRPRKIVPLSKTTNSNIVKPQAIGGDLDLDLLPKFDGLDFGEKNNTTDVLAKTVNKYFYIVYLVNSDEDNSSTQRIGHSINVESQLFLFPFHFILLVSKHIAERKMKNPEIIFSTTNGRIKYRVNINDFLYTFKTTESAADNDICLLKIKSAQLFSKGIINNLLTKDDYSKLLRTTSFEAILFGTRTSYEDKTTIFLNTSYINASMNKGSITVDAVWDDNNSAYNLFNTFMYKTNSGKGDCGSLLTVNDSNFGNRIFCGIHTAGGKNLGFSASLDYESVKELIRSTYGEHHTFIKEEVPSFLCDPIIEPESGLDPVYMLDPSFYKPAPSRSAITKSILHGHLPEPYSVVSTLPAKLKSFTDEKGHLHDPGKMSFAKYSLDAPPIDSKKVDAAINSYENLVVAHSTTKMECRNSYPLRTVLHSFENLNTIASSTSSGFPMSNMSSSDLKKIYYTAVQEGDHLLAENTYQRIDKEVQRVISLYEKGIRPFFAYKQCLKDETLPREKVLVGKTRLFSACPFIMLCMFRMYFGSFISEYFSMNLDVGSAVGINPYSMDWDSLARRLLSFADSTTEPAIGAGDQGQFDARQWPIIHNGVLDMINRWYGNDNPDNLIRSQLYQEIAFSRHLYEDHIYQWHSALPSGNPMTAVLNTIYNNIVFRIAWITAELDINLFNSNVYVAVLGDDNIFSVSKPYKDIFNELTLPKLMQYTGNKYTTELKDEAIHKFRPIDRVEFLKRSFRRVPELNRWVAPLREEAIAEMLNWTKKGRESAQITLDNMVFAIREFSLHGKDKYDYWREKLLILKHAYFPRMFPHGDIPMNYELCLEMVLKLIHQF